MRWLLILATLPALAANYPLQQSYLLAAGTTAITVTNLGSGGGTSTLNLPTGPSRYRFTVSENCVPPAGTPERPQGTTTYSALAGNPAAVSVFQSWGVPCYWHEAVDSGGSVLSPRVVSSRLTIPQIQPTTLAAGAWSFPIEVIGQDGFIQSRQFTISGGAITSVRLRIRAHNTGYKAKNPVDGKGSVRINSGAWVDLTNANVTCIGEQRYFGCIGSTVPVQEFTLAVANGVLVNGTNTIDFRFNGTDGVTSGYRILDFNFIETAIATKGYSVTANVATMTCATPCSFSTGDWVYLYSQPGMYAFANGNFQVTAVGSTHFTFVPCRVSGNLLPDACTSPNGTYAAPASQYVNVFATPIAYVARESIPFSQFSQDDPSAWTAPSGGVAADGLTFFQTATIVVPATPYNNFQTVAKCSSCHFLDGSDLLSFGYSNHAIEQRTLFHGGTWQNAKDVAAYIRSLGSVPPTGRPWNPPYQPGPGLDSAALASWRAGAGIDSVLTYDNDLVRYIIPSGSFAGWVKAQQINWRETPIPVMFLDWNSMLPAIYPGDFTFQNVSGSTIAYTGSVPEACRASAMANITAGDVTSFGTFACPGGVGGDPYLGGFGTDVKAWVDVVNLARNGSGATNPAPGYRRPSNYNLALMSIQNKAIVDFLDINIAKGFEGKLDQIYTAIYGSSANGYFARGYYGAFTVFAAAPHFVSTSTYGLYDETTISWNHVSNWVYVLCMPLNAGNRRVSQGHPFDLNYLSAFIATEPSPLGYMMEFTHLLGVQQGADLTTVPSDSALISAVEPQLMSLGNGQRPQFAEVLLSTSDRVAKYTRMVDNMVITLNAFSASTWRAVFTNWATCCTPDFGRLGSGGNAFVGDGIAYMLPVLKHMGVNTTSLGNLATVAATIWARDFTGVDLAATCTWTDGPGSSASTAALPTCTNLTF